jgi:hypothetical protein
VSADHVARGVSLGIAQVNHGKRAGLDRMRPGDWFVYYSPRQGMREGPPVQAFTAIGEITEGTVWQADEGCFRPWRRAVKYRTTARRVTIADLHDRLDLTAAPNWGYQLRRGLLPLTDRDLTTITGAMTGEAPTTRTEPPAALTTGGLW